MVLDHANLIWVKWPSIGRRRGTRTSARTGFDVYAESTGCTRRVVQGIKQVPYTYKGGRPMPVGKQLSEYTGKFTSIRVCDSDAENGSVEGCYTAKVAGDIAGTAVGTMTFTGSNERGTLVDLGMGYLDSGDTTPYKAQGVYWASAHGTWQTRAAVTMGDQMLVVEGQINLSNGEFSTTGGVHELT